MSEEGGNRVDEIFSELQAQILSGTLEAGARLPSERQLAERYGMNRHTLREASIRLEQQGLVTVRHGQGATVSDFRRTGSLTVLAPFLEHAADPAERARVLADLLPARVEVLAVAAGLASRRATEADRARLMEATQAVVGQFIAGDRAAVAEAYAQWLDALVDAAHSLPVRWIANALLDVNARIMARFPGLWVLEPTFPDHMMEVTLALTDGDGERAVSSMRAYFARVDATLGQLLETVLSDEG